MAALKAVAEDDKLAAEEALAVDPDATYNYRAITLHIPNITEFAYGNEVFKEISSLGCVVMPNVTNIVGDNIFEGCTSLTDVDMDSLVTIDGDSVFKDCSALKTLDMDSLTTITGSDIFEGCTSLDSSEIPNLQ
ncbi:MAG: leucine-rich repeat protein [Rikenellaceae bacterium]